MLEAMRRGAQTWVAKLLFGILVFSFAIWGVADVFRGWGQGSIASVGRTPITAEEFNRSFQSELDQFSKQANRRLTPAEGRSLGIDRRVLNQLVGGAAIEQHANNLGLSLSDQSIVDMVMNDPDFKGADGKFSRQGFDAFLRQVGLSEKGFVELRKRDQLRTDMIGAFVTAQTVPKPMLETIYAYNNEKRTIAYVDINPEKAVTVTDPDEAKLKELYEAGKSGYMTPEYRKFEILLLSPDDLKKTIQIPDSDVKAEYEKTKESYDIPEKRRIQQIPFKDKAAAEAAKKALDAGTKTFGEVAKDAGAQDTDVDLGLITKAQLIDKKIADAAFSLDKDKISDVIEGTFATVLLRVTQIEPGVTKTFDDVKDEVKDKLATAKAQLLVQETRDQIEDARNAGKTPKEIAETMKLTYKQVDAADSRGLMPDGKPALQTTDLRKIMAEVFSPDTGLDQEGIDLPDNTFAWVNTISTAPPKQKTFDEVKDEVKARYMSNERTRLISELASKLVERVDNGEPLSAIEAAAGNTVQKTDPVTRTTIPQGLSQSAVAQAFALQKGKAGSAETADRQSRVVLQVEDITPASAPSKEDLDKLAKEISPELSNQVLTEYTEALKKQLGATVNEAELQRVLGTSEE
ncbi:MAG: SurA N-terminal domain-containing protein [Hyphomicrobium sp.]